MNDDNEYEPTDFIDDDEDHEEVVDRFLGDTIDDDNEIDQVDYINDDDD